MQNNINLFKEIEELIQNEKDIGTRINLCSIAAHFASYNYSGSFYSCTLENTLTSISDQIFLNYTKSEVEYQKNSFLHVMTESHTTGGHTRVVENWINNSKYSQNSIYIIDPDCSIITDFMISSVKNTNGTIYKSQFTDKIDIAKELFTIASNYEYIILHIHMFDVVPMLAFGNNVFKRPVIFFNHASHMFWIGKSISDNVLTMSEGEIKFNKEKRSINNSLKLPIPIKVNTESKFTLEEKGELLKRLKIDDKKKIILSIGMTSRYLTKSKNNFFNLVNYITSKYENIHFVIIGPEYNESVWQKQIEHKNKVSLLGKIDRSELEKYIHLADLYVESFPLGSGTASLEVIASNKKAILAKSFFIRFDSCLDMEIDICNISDEVEKYILDGNYNDNLLIKIKEQIQNEHFEEGWLSYFNKLKENFSKEHKITYCISAPNFLDEVDRETFNYLNDNISGKTLISKDFLELSTSKKFLLMYIFIKHKPLSLIKFLYYKLLKNL